MEVDPIEIVLYHPKEDLTSEYVVKVVDENIYETLENSPFIEELSYGVQFEVEKEKNADGAFVFKKVVKESDYTVQVININLPLDDDELLDIGDMIVEKGGGWEVIFGGFAYVNLPKGSSFDIIKEIQSRIKGKTGTI